MFAEPAASACATKYDCAYCEGGESGTCGIVTPVIFPLATLIEATTFPQGVWYVLPEKVPLTPTAVFAETALFTGVVVRVLAATGVGEEVALVATFFPEGVFFDCARALSSDAWNARLVIVAPEML